MENVIFEVLTKAGFLLASILLFVGWVKAGMPYPTISRK